MRDTTIAWIAAAAHAVAAAAMLLWLRAGLPPAPDDERIPYIASHRIAWTSGWLTWQLAVLSLIALYAVLARRFRGALPLAALAVSGFALAIAALMHHALGEIVSSAILFPLFTLWTILIARWLRNA